jgi:hypothetical protein
MNQTPIKLNDLLQVSDLENFKLRMLTTYSKTTNPLDFFRSNNNEELMKWLFWNYSKKSFKVGETVIGLLRLDGDRWLLFNISKVTKDLNQFSGLGYEFETVSQYQQYFGRVIVEYKNKAQTLIRKASGMLNDCTVTQIIEDKYEDEEFPGYEKANISWEVMNRVLKKSSWKSALQNQKGVYLITDSSTGKMYIGSAYGKDMLLGRWDAYLRNGHGGNVDLKELELKYIKENFRYSILDIFKSTVEDKFIIARESWWKETLMTRMFGYNRN